MADIDWHWLFLFRVKHAALTTSASEGSIMPSRRSKLPGWQAWMQKHCVGVKRHQWNKTLQWNKQSDGQWRQLFVPFVKMAEVGAGYIHLQATSSPVSIIAMFKISGILGKKQFFDIQGSNWQWRRRWLEERLLRWVHCVFWSSLQDWHWPTMMVSPNEAISQKHDSSSN